MNILIIFSAIITSVYSLPECGNDYCVNNTMCDNGYKCQNCYSKYEIYEKTCIGI